MVYTCGTVKMFGKIGSVIVLLVLNGTIVGLLCLLLISEFGKVRSCLCCYLTFTLMTGLAEVTLIIMYLLLLMRMTFFFKLPPSLHCRICLRLCKARLNYLDMSINSKKTCCLRTGPIYAVNCCTVSTAEGCVISWVSEMRYLGVFVVHSRRFKFKCAYDKLTMLNDRSIVQLMVYLVKI